MYVECSGVAVVRHGDTGVEYEVSHEELDWETSVSDPDRDMGPEYLHEAAFEHDELGTLTWHIWEYPLGMKSSDATDVGGHELVSNLHFDLQHDSVDPEEWLDYAVPENPHTVFLNSYLHTSELLKEKGSNDGANLLNRMVFSHQVTALEAYLGDTLINVVMDEPECLQRLIARADELKQEKFSLEEISKERNLVHRKVREYLRGILYHNLSKADVLYEIALGFGILNKMKDRKAMFVAMSLRHDCVHRNGRDKDGKELTVFTKGFVQTTADRIKDLVAEVEAEVDRRRFSPS